MFLRKTIITIINTNKLLLFKKVHRARDFRFWLKSKIYAGSRYLASKFCSGWLGKARAQFSISVLPSFPVPRDSIWM